MTEQQKRMFIKQWQWRNNYYPQKQRQSRFIRGLLLFGSAAVVLSAIVRIIVGPV